ncbi:glycoside hydrolase family 65 protein [Ilumatobacter sp.]|uniref:glycoside hydrolase family 65 protein n=1 Tax=Ilumatobacter sp. TaxID=1967498 RepID=UPI003AF76CDF
MSRFLLTYKGYEPAEEGLREAICTLGNGYVATRGAAPEVSAGDVHYPGTYFAGLYNRLGTEMSGRVIENEDLVNAPNWLPLQFRMADDETWFSIEDGSVENFELELDVGRGVLTRSFVWTDGRGRRTLVNQRRFVSMRDPHVAGLETAFRAENWSGGIVVRSALDGTVVNAGVPRYRSLESRHLEPLETRTVGDDGIALTVCTTQSRVTLAMAARTRVVDGGSPSPTERTTSESAGWIGQDLRFDVVQGESISVEKIVTIFSSRDRAISEPGLESREHLAVVGSFQEMLDAHVLSWDHLWRRFQFESEADEDTSRILNLHVFHLLQTASKHTIDRDVGIPARGWHGEAYRGHIFWDELFIFPFLTLHMPDLTKALLQYRYRRLAAASRAAAAEGYEGAMYPWQSGSNGREETQTVHLNPQSGHWHPDKSHRQRHINIAIAYNVWKYFEATDDVEFMAFQGTEMLIQIARFWASIATYDKALHRFEIRGVMGPDEYHDGYPDSDEAGLRNNAYTNIMVVWLLQRAQEALEVVPEFRRRELWEKLALRREELERWQEVCDRMVVPFHDGDIISQFEGYEQLAEFDWQAYVEKYGNIQRLDRILEAEGDTPNRYKVSKQADVLMLFYLLSGEEIEEIVTRLGYEWHDALIQRNVDYYLPRTSHGSTLSRVVQSYVLARSDRTRSWAAFQEALHSDIADVQGGTTAEGIHLGAMAGTVDLAQRCFSGLDTRGGVLRFDPAIPDELQWLRFDLQYRGGWVQCEMSAKMMSITSHEGAVRTIKIAIRDDEFELHPGALRRVELR